MSDHLSLRSRQRISSLWPLALGLLIIMTSFATPAAAGGFETLYSFCSVGGFSVCSDGGVPSGGVVIDKSGNIYGTTTTSGANGKGGVVYKLTRVRRRRTTIRSFTASARRQIAPMDKCPPRTWLSRRGEYLREYCFTRRNNRGTVFELSPGAAVTRRRFFIASVRWAISIAPPNARPTTTIALPQLTKKNNHRAARRENETQLTFRSRSLFQRDFDHFFSVANSRRQWQRRGGLRTRFEPSWDRLQRGSSESMRRQDFLGRPPPIRIIFLMTDKFCWSA